MINTDTVAVDLVASNGVIDDMEASTGVFGADDKAVLADYQVTLASARTTLSQDIAFIGLLMRYMIVKSQR